MHEEIMVTFRPSIKIQIVLKRLAKFNRNKIQNPVKVLSVRLQHDFKLVILLKTTNCQMTNLI